MTGGHPITILICGIMFLLFLGLIVDIDKKNMKTTINWTPDEDLNPDDEDDIGPDV